MVDVYISFYFVVLLKNFSCLFQLSTLRKCA